LEVPESFRFAMLAKQKVISNLEIQEIDDFISTAIDPTCRIFSEQQLKNEYNFPTDDELLDIFADCM
jgi:hypothetical protein